MKLNKLITAIAGSILISANMGVANAATWDISVTNLTHSNVFTPLYMIAHDQGSEIFEPGEIASSEIEVMAECGDNSALVTLNNGANTEFNGSTLTMSGMTTSNIQLVTEASMLSVVAMILPTNDAFIGLKQFIPAQPGTYTYFVAGYDAGTESNTEVIDAGNSGETCQTDTQNVIPADPGGLANTGGSGVTTPENMTTAQATADTNTTIHIHRGVLGNSADDMNAKSDLINSIHRWQNPVAKVVVTVTR